MEGQDDLFSVVGLMSAHINWPDIKYDAPVLIVPENGVEDILDPEYISVLLKASEIDVLGFMLDADTKPVSRYGRIRAVCQSAFPDLPEDLPADGLVAENADKKRLGVWVMPDNKTEGCLETFLHELVPDESAPVWAHAGEAMTRAQELGASWRDSHEPKVRLYTWLAWQEPPGQSPGRALTQKILDPHSTRAESFVAWFRGLYQL